MKSLQLKNPGVFAIESLWWDKNIDALNTSIDCIFTLIKSNYSWFNYTVRSSNTLEELSHNLDLAKKNQGKFRVLYFGSHGFPNGLEISTLNNVRISLEELSELMGTRFNLWSIHFGSCSVLNTEEENIRNFMRKTGVKSVTGYAIDVDWIESAALDLLYFSNLCYSFDNLEKFRKTFIYRYSELIDINKFKFYLKGD